MKPFLHARGSVGRWGGQPSDYMAIHDFIDSSKAAMPDLRHRALYHHAMGCYLVERIFGHTLINSDGREVSTRDVAENHIIEDMGFLPSVEDWLESLPQDKWHGGIHRLVREERPVEPSVAREARRNAVIDAVARGIYSGTLQLVEDCETKEDGARFDRAIDRIIAAAGGITLRDDEVA